MLTPCTSNPIQGEVRPGDPGIELHEDVLYGPVASHAWHDEPHWGIYDRAGCLIDAAAYYRGPGKATVGQSAFVDRGAIPAAEAPDETYIYGGILVEHFGHFLLSSFSRFWPFVPGGPALGPHRILCHGVLGPDHWWTLPYKRELLQALGIPRERLAWFPGPTRIRRLVVPRPAFEEHNFVHAAYVRLARWAGAALLGQAAGACGPAYLSRTRYPKLSQGFENEALLAEGLAALGVEVCHPEDLSLAGQVGTLTGRAAVAGQISSAFHAAAFSPDPAPLVLLSPTSVVSPNFAMLDRAAGLDAQYWHVDAAFLGVDHAARIVNRFRINDPAATLRETLALIQAACMRGTNRRRPGALPGGP